MCVHACLNERKSDVSVQHQRSVSHNLFLIVSQMSRQLLGKLKGAYYQSPGIAAWCVLQILSGEVKANINRAGLDQEPHNPNFGVLSRMP